MSIFDLNPKPRDRGSAPMTARQRLPNRRACESFEFRHAGLDFTLAAGFYPDGRIAEIFLSSHKPGSPIEAIARDAAVRRAPKALPPAWPGSRGAPGAPRVVVVEDRDHAACVAFLSTCPGVDVDRLFIVVTHVDMGGDPGPAEWLRMARGES